MPDLRDHSTGSALSLPEDIFMSVPLQGRVIFTGRIPSCMPTISNFLPMASASNFYNYVNNNNNMAQSVPCCTAEVLSLCMSTCVLTSPITGCVVCAL